MWRSTSKMSTNRACPLPFILFLCLFLSYGPFNCISFHKFSQQFYVFSLCSSGLISVLLVLSTLYFFMTVSLSPDIIPSNWLGSKHWTTNIVQDATDCPTQVALPAVFLWLSNVDFFINLTITQLKNYCGCIYHSIPVDRACGASFLHAPFNNLCQVLHFPEKKKCFPDSPTHATSRAQRLQYLCPHTIFNLLKILILSHNPLCMGGTKQQQQKSNKMLLFCVCRSNSRYKDKDCIKTVAFIWFILVLHANNSVLIFLQSLVPLKGH